MPRKNFLWIILLLSVALSAMIQTRASPGTPTASVSPLKTTKVIGESFSVNLTLGDVQDVWTFEYVLKYNTTLLNVTDYSIYDYYDAQGNKILTMRPETVINEPAGYARIVAYGEMGSYVGFGTTDEKPIARIDFLVTANGSCTLDLDDENCVVATIYGDVLYPVVFNDGYFSTEEIELHDLAVTDVRVSSTSVYIGDTVTIDVDVKNKGDFTENFTVSIKYNSTAIIYTQIGSSAVTNLAPDDSTSRQFTWDTSNVAEGKYAVTAEAKITDDALPADNQKESVAITVAKRTGSPINITYIAIGIVVVIVVAIGAYALIIRKR